MRTVCYLAQCFLQQKCRYTSSSLSLVSQRTNKLRWLKKEYVTIEWVQTKKMFGRNTFFKQGKQTKSNIKPTANLLCLHNHYLVEINFHSNDLTENYPCVKKM